MSRQVTFDYSKAGSFISEEEIGYMKKLPWMRRRPWYPRPVPAMISWDGSIFP